MMGKAMKVFALILVCVLVVAGGVLIYAWYRLRTFPEFEVAAERTSVTDEEIFGWIERIVSFGPRKPASESDERTREFIQEKFEEFGLDVAEPEPVAVETARVGEWSLTLRHEPSGEEIPVPTYPMPFPAATQSEAEEGEAVLIGEGGEMASLELAGKVAVFEQPLKPQGWELYRRLFFFYDPARSIPKGYTIPNMVETAERSIYDRLVSAGAMGMVGLLSALPWESDTFCPQLNHGVSKKIPGYWVSPKNSAVVKEWLARGDVTAIMKMDAEQGRSQTYNLWAVLPGRVNEYYIVMCHHDAPFSNAVQDASGVSIVLALAKHFSHVHEERPLKRGIVFLAGGGHMLGRLGEMAFVERHRDFLLSDTVLVISVEHIAKEFLAREDMAFSCSEQPSPRMFLTTWNKNVNGIVKSAILRNDYRRCVIIPQWIVRKTTGKARGISGEFYEAGKPVVGLLSNPPYMFFKEDTPETVARDQLVPTTNLIISILRAADELPADNFGRTAN
jgi:hypothetical protein